MKTPPMPQRNPVAALGRKARARRRVGLDNKCQCGESRPEALIPGTDPITCAECQRKKHDKSVLDKHHVAGRANDPLTVSIPANDHRADLSVKQQDWPEETLENPNGSPLRKDAARIRGIIDMIMYLLFALLIGCAERTEALDEYLTEKDGPNWWIGTPLEEFAPKKEREENDKP